MAIKGQEFSELVRRLADGEADTELSSELTKLLLELRSQAELRNVVVSGGFKLNLTIKCNPKGQLDISHKFDTKRPAKSSLPTTAWATKNGVVSFDMPKQQKLPMVDVEPPRMVDVTDDEDDAEELRKH